ncbi:MAG: sigma-54 dependent transcriptional regulator [Planctomycetes bacterium]|nr:sigma-54 dependent transcriptional regulator [Planctomycetota bacterium]
MKADEFNEEQSTLTDHYRALRITFSSIVTKNAAMLECLDRARKAAASDATILILGGNGTGKNLIAQAIHNASPRIDRPLVAINCSAIPETLLESELFGHEKGSFTGAQSQRKGCFERAHEGTLFMDEIGDMSFTAQAKILRAVEYHEFERVGGEETLRSDVRIIAASNQSLEKLIQERRFRLDLYYRLAEVTLKVPALVDRKDDIPLLAELFVRECARKYAKNIGSITPDAVDKLAGHSWPGNVRELRAVIKRAVAICPGGEITASEIELEKIEVDAPEQTKSGPAATTQPSLTMSLSEMEKLHIQNVLAEVGGNKSAACRVLGISRPTLDRKLKSLEID